MDIQLLQHHLLKRLSIFHCTELHLGQKSIFHTCVGLFLYPLFCSIDFIPNPCQYHTVEYYSNVISLKTRQRESYHFILLFQNCISYCSLSPHINFRILYYKSCWDFDRNCIKPVYQLGENWHLTMLNF